MLFKQTILSKVANEFYLRCFIITANSFHTEEQYNKLMNELYSIDITLILSHNNLLNMLCEYKNEPYFKLDPMNTYLAIGIIEDPYELQNMLYGYFSYLEEFIQNNNSLQDKIVQEFQHRCDKLLQQKTYQSILTQIECFKAIKKYPNLISYENERKIVHMLIKTVHQMDDTEEKYYLIKDLFMYNIFDPKLLNRLLFRIDPIPKPSISGLYDYTDKSPDIIKKERLNQQEVMKYLFDYDEYRASIELRTYADLKLIISKSTPAAKSMLRKLLFSNGKRKAFILDETMQPMGVDYGAMQIDDTALIRPYTNNKIPDKIEWAKIFQDFKIIPLIDYFK